MARKRVVAVVSGTGTPRRACHRGAVWRPNTFRPPGRRSLVSLCAVHRNKRRNILLQSVPMPLYKPFAIGRELPRISSTANLYGGAFYVRRIHCGPPRPSKQMRLPVFSRTEIGEIVAATPIVQRLAYGFPGSACQWGVCTSACAWSKGEEVWRRARVMPKSNTQVKPAQPRSVAYRFRLAINNCRFQLIGTR